MGCTLSTALAASPAEDFFSGSLYFRSTGTLKNKNCSVNTCIPGYIRNKLRSEPPPTKSFTSPMQSQQLARKKSSEKHLRSIRTSLTRSARTAPAQQLKTSLYTQREVRNR